MTNPYEGETNPYEGEIEAALKAVLEELKQAYQKSSSADRPAARRAFMRAQHFFNEYITKHGTFGRYPT